MTWEEKEKKESQGTSWPSANFHRTLVTMLQKRRRVCLEQSGDFGPAFLSWMSGVLQRQAKDTFVSRGHQSRICRPRQDAAVMKTPRHDMQVSCRTRSSSAGRVDSPDDPERTKSDGVPYPSSLPGARVRWPQVLISTCIENPWVLSWRRFLKIVRAAGF